MNTYQYQILTLCVALLVPVEPNACSFGLEPSRRPVVADVSCVVLVPQDGRRQVQGAHREVHLSKATGQEERRKRQKV